MNKITDSLGIQTELIPRIACPHCEVSLDISMFEAFEDIICPQCDGHIKVPARLGEYLLLDDVGHGAMGRVYLARDENLMRMVALKVIRREYGDDPAMLESIQREAQAMAALNHRNIAQIHSFGRVEGQPYFVMELLEGERLEDLIKEPKPIPEEKLLKIALHAAYGLAAAEEAGMTHGDIKPANILLNLQGVAKLVDFGLARFMDAGEAGNVWGTPYYLPPEKVRKQGEDGRSDQYSLGATLYHAFTGRPPFSGADPKAVVMASLKDPTPRVREFRPDVSEKTDQLIRRMMHKDPDKRYQSYAELTTELKDTLKTVRNPRRIPVRGNQIPKPAVRKRGIPLFVKLTWGGVAVAGLGLGAFLWQSGAFTSPNPDAQAAEGTQTANSSSGEKEEGFSPLDKEAPWTPAQITTSAWYDPSDESTITENGGLVSQLGDKSGNGLDVGQSKATNQPTTGTRTINGLNALDFQGGNMQLWTGGATQADPNKISFLAVYDLDSITGQVARLIYGGDGYGQVMFGEKRDRMKVGTNKSGSSNTISVGTSTSANMVSYVMSNDSLQEAWLNGTSLGTQTNTLNLTPMNLIYYGNRMDGKVGEVIWFFDEIDTDTRQKMEGYLAHKWGLENNLPSRHPYKFSPP